jgi:hypothetical protein
MAKEKLEIKFDKPPIHVANSGALYINADDIIHSEVGQTVILRMATIKPLPPEKSDKQTGSVAEPVE